MTLREVTRTVIKRVEDASGCPVVVSEDTSLKTLTDARIARGANRIHLRSFGERQKRGQAGFLASAAAWEMTDD